MSTVTQYLTCISTILLVTRAIVYTYILVSRKNISTRLIIAQYQNFYIGRLWTLHPIRTNPSVTMLKKKILDFGF